MVGIRLNILCKQFDVGMKAMIAFLSSKGFVVSSSPNSLIPESAIPLLQKEFGNKENKESLILPDSPYRNGVTGKYKLLVKNVTELFGNYEYLLVDADGNEYKAIAQPLFSVGDMLRCMVSFKVEKAMLVVENVAVCNKQDLASPIYVEKTHKPKTELIQEAKKGPELRSKTKTKTKSNLHPNESDGIKLGNPRKKLVSGVYLLRVSRVVNTNVMDYSYWVKDVNGIEYPFLSKRFLKVGKTYFFKVNVFVSTEGVLKVDVLSVINIEEKANQSKSGQKKRKHSSKHGVGKGKAFYKKTTGYRQNSYDALSTGGFHLIYTRM